MSAGEGFVAVKRRAVARAVPLTAYLELTYRCQWRCVFCYNPRHHDLRGLGVDEWCGVLDELRALGTLCVVLTGGDPMTHPGFWEIAQAARERAFALRVLTNGSAVTDQAARKLAGLRVLAVEMSLHGATAAVHERATARPGSYDRVLCAVRSLRRHGVPVVLKTLLTSINSAELGAIVALAAEHDVPLRVDPAVTPRDDGSFEPVRFAPSAAAVRRLMRELREQGRVPTVEERPAGAANCGVGRSTVAIDPEGRVFPCMQWRADSLGNVRDAPLRELWSTSPVRDEVVRVAVAANERLRGIGGAVASFPFCPGVALQLTGDPTAPDPAFVRNAGAAERMRLRRRPSSAE